MCGRRDAVTRADLAASRPFPPRPSSSGAVRPARLLDTALFDSRQPSAPLKLQGSKKVLDSGSVTNPMTVLANYVFCVVEADAFQLDSEGDLTEALLTTTASRAQGEVEAGTRANEWSGWDAERWPWGWPWCGSVACGQGVLVL